jgi:polyhydroxybutyrate depolymerase
MKRKLLLSICLLAFALTSFAQVTLVDSFMCGGMYRSYRLYVPAAYTGTTARPLILNLHGYSSNASEQQLYSNFSPIADTANFLMVYPQGTMYMGQPYWNAGLVSGGVNDIEFLSQLIDTISASYNVDANSVFSCGMSNGGYMSQTLACELSNKVAAIASVTGSMFSSQHAVCAPPRPVPMMQIHGTSDGTVNYYGSAGSLSIDQLVSFWVDHNDCNPTAVMTPVPNTSTSDGCTAERYVYSGGASGSSVELFKVNGGGHTWPGAPFIIGVTNQDFSASKEIWRFFRKYKLNTLTSIEEKKSVEVLLYPNPATDLIHIRTAELRFVSITDMSGRVVLESKSADLDVSALESGSYFVKVQVKGGEKVLRFVKTR